MREETRNEKWGSGAAAPLFGAIGRAILRYLEVPPRDVQPAQIVTGPPAEPVSPARMRLVSTAEAAQPDGTRRMPDLGGKTLRQALEVLEPLRVEVRLYGQGRVFRQVTAAGDPLEPGAVPRLTLTASGGTR